MIQNRNYDRLLRERQRFMPLASRIDAEGETLFLRISEYAAALWVVTSPWSSSSSS